MISEEAARRLIMWKDNETVLSVDFVVPPIGFTGEGVKIAPNSSGTVLELKAASFSLRFGFDERALVSDESPDGRPGVKIGLGDESWLALFELRKRSTH